MVPSFQAVSFPINYGGRCFLTVMPLGQPYLHSPSLKLPSWVILDFGMLTIKTNPSFLFYFSDLSISF